MSWGVMAEQLGWGIIEEGWRKGPWTAEEDRKLNEYVKLHGEGRWNSVARLTGLKRNGKSCRLRWVNYLRPDLKRGQITPQEEKIILDLHDRWGNRWSTIARSLPGRTDNEIKNYWRTHFKKKAKNSDNPEKSRARLLKKQQFQQQQLQQQQQQQFQQQLLQPQSQVLDMKRIISLLDETTHDHQNRSSSSTSTPLITRQDTACSTFTNTAADNQDQSCFLYSFLNGGYASALPSQVSNEEMIMWDSLWNMDDFHGNNMNIMAAATTYATPFYY